MKANAAVFALPILVALSGCALIPTSSSSPPTMRSCVVSGCGVPVEHHGWWPFYGLEVADVVDVTAPRPTIITWKLIGRPQTRFHHTKGITFEDSRIVCKIDEQDDHIYTCTDHAPPGKYKYSIQAMGPGAPPDPKDPWIVNR